MPGRLVPDPDHPGAFEVVVDGASQSWVDPRDPLRLEFEYVQRIASILEATVLASPPDERVRVVHLGGGGLSLPRYVEARRPHTAQIVLDPDADLMAEVRRKLPLARNSGIKVRELDGRSGLEAMPAGYAHAIVVDAFAGARVPGELATAEFFAEVARVLRPWGTMAMNLTDRAPFDWARRCLAGVTAVFGAAVASAEPAVWKGRRFGNLVVAASRSGLPVGVVARSAAGAPFPCQVRHGLDLLSWIGAADPFADADSQASPAPPWGRGWFS